MADQSLWFSLELFSNCNSMPSNIPEIDMVGSIGGDITLLKGHEQSLVLFDEHALEIVRWGL